MWKKFVVGNRPDGTPNGLGLVMQNGKRVNVCAECIEKCATDKSVIDKIMWGEK